MIAAGRKKELNPVVISLFFVFIVMLYVLNVLPSK
jgi:adenine/guanine/hypoxanthine permease